MILFELFTPNNLDVDIEINNLHECFERYEQTYFLY